jgi:Holliday junction resolvasome RuvABC endonuclease subunit
MNDTDLKPNAWIGVDPGSTTGAYAILRENGNYDIEEWEDEYRFASDIAEWKEMYRIYFAVVEAVHSMPKQGVSSVFKFGTSYGLARGVLAAHSIRVELITPQTWQKAMLHNADGPNTKTRSICAARRNFPDLQLKKTQHGKSDAILMALYAMRHFYRF